MKSLIKKVINQAVRINWMWNSLSKTIIPLAYYAQIAKLQGEKRETIPVSPNPVFEGMAVMHGVFAGMK